MANRVLVASHYAPVELDSPRVILFGGGESATVKCRDDLILDVAHYFQVVEDEGPDGPYRCRTLGYTYDFRHVDGPSVLAFHWHPESRVKIPHAHTPQYTTPVDLTRIHIPTGRTSFEAVIRLAIEEFGAVPLRDDWDQVLTTAERAFIEHREWQ